MPRAQACTVSVVNHAATQPAPGERALSRMRRYTTISIMGVVVLYSLMVLLQAQQPVTIVALVLSSIAVTLYSAFWERPAPAWASLSVIGLAFATWSLSIAFAEGFASVVLLAVALATYTCSRPARRWLPLVVVTVALCMAPVVVRAVVSPQSVDPEWFTLVGVAVVGAFAVFSLNRYGFNLYLEIDAAKGAAAELAVVQERYRFAADLHDIQGHTLHVIRLKTQLADRLIDTDPAAAHEQLREAQELIVQTLADTKSLAFGDRQVAFASELANAEALLTAAGIRWTLEGSLPNGPHDELFGLVMREATTNILRHAQATTVHVTLSPGHLEIINDGSPSAPRVLSGLARLNERFEAAGGSLTTKSADGRFSTIARVS